MNFFRHEKLPAVLLMGSAAFVVLFGYECIRSPAYTLMKQAYGKEILPWSMAIMPVGVFLMVVIYNKALSMVGPRWTLVGTCAVSTGVVLGCFGLWQLGWQPASLILFVFGQGYIVLIIEQFWSFLNSTFSAEDAKLFNGPVTGIGSIGAILAGLLVGGAAESLGTPAMVFIAAFTMAPAGFFALLAYRKYGDPPRHTESNEESTNALGLGEFRTEPLLRWILLLVVSTQFLSASLTLEFQNTLTDTYPLPDKQTSFSGYFFATINAVACFAQFILAPLAMRWLSPVVVQILMPAINLSVAICAWVFGGIWWAAAAVLVFKSIDYSLFRAAKEILYIPLSFDARFRAKELIDVFGYRVSKGGASFLIGSLQGIGWLGTHMSVVSVGAGFIWLACTGRLAKYIRI